MSDAFGSLIDIERTAGATITNPATTVPESGTFGLLGAGLIGLLLRRKRVA